jgi:hypothetical protein
MRIENAYRTEKENKQKEASEELDKPRFLVEIHYGKKGSAFQYK